MKQPLSAAALVLASQLVFAQPPVTAPAAASGDCEARAFSKEGKPLAGAAKAAFIKKCAADAGKSAAAQDCAAKAVSKEGKPLAGAAREAFIKKCEKDAPAQK